MNRKLILLFLFFIPLFSMAQSALVREYDYDAAGNRILRKTVQLYLSPPAPQDSLQVTSDELQVTSDEYFVEKLAQVEIKIYPNPATEKITLAISNMETLQTGSFKLFSLSGQLLQEHPVYAAATEVSLAGLPNGAYILKVHINGKSEDWKIIKQ